MTETGNRYPVMKPADSAEAITIARKEIMEKFGISFSELKDGSAVASVRILPKDRNFYGIPYGGFLFNLADNTAGMAFLSAGGNGITVSGYVSYYRGADPEAESLICRARVVKQGRNLFFVNADVEDASGRLLSSYSFIFTNL